MAHDTTAIRVENISKCYRIGLKENMHNSFAGTIFNVLKSPLKNYRKYRSLYKFDDVMPNSDPDSHSLDIIWALRDISFEVVKGEVVGIIGSNGAGKSTLLKILSKITTPTGGHAEIRGRVSSLLEVGTGFHQELTGRENIYLNGTILGMTKKEVDRSYDNIVEFSGVEKFIDTPVKRYSSGMTVRLAFSVAAHLEPEILMIDEVLSVGDAAFQNKCIGKMEAVAQGGRTVLFVSHNMAAVAELCKRVIWVEDGRIRLVGPPSEIIPAYLGAEGNGEEGTWQRPVDSAENEEVQFKSVRLLNPDGEVASIIDFGVSFKVEIKYEVTEPIRDLSITVQIFNSRGTMVFESMNTDMPEGRGQTQKPGQYLAICTGPSHLLKPDQYTVSLSAFVSNVKLVEVQERVLSFKISEAGYYPHGRQGVVSPLLPWEIKRILPF